ncbi:MAG: hypothetical protein CME65_12320 [Halobacteriovoraceae bacterium]|nr:hypothetical protein [Halobacteriovoraceae bacterium]|tara:strand:- start:17047 stop:17838 length:792 start_codon:yes stop_codon:yes gene_type:complete
MKIKIAFLYCILFILSGCGGCSSNLYRDILKAEELLTKQKFEEAVVVYNGVLKKKPSKQIQIKINFQLGEIYSIYLNNYELSLEYFNKIIEESNEPAWQVLALEKVSNIYFEGIADYERAKTYYSKLIQFSPVLKNQNFYKYRFAQSQLNLGQYKDSISSFDELIEDTNSEYKIQSYYHKGLAYFYLHDWNQAIESWYDYLKYEQRRDRITKTKFLIANSYESAEKLKEAYNIYYSILGEYPNPDVVKNRLNSLYERRISRKR